MCKRQLRALFIKIFGVLILSAGINTSVCSEEAEKLAMAENGGKLRLALRSPINPDVMKTTGANFNDLMQSHQKKRIKAKRKYKPSNKVEVISGTDRKTMKF